MGRGTYDHIAHLDPLPFGSRPVFVFTHRPPAPRNGVTFWQVSPRAALSRWTAMGLGRVYVVDGGRLISDFLAEGLIDDLVLTKVPVLLGDGLPLFHPIGVSTALRLESAQNWPSGFVNLTYSRALQRGEVVGAPHLRAKDSSAKLVIGIRSGLVGAGILQLDQLALEIGLHEGTVTTLEGP